MFKKTIGIIVIVILLLLKTGITNAEDLFNIRVNDKFLETLNYLPNEFELWSKGSIKEITEVYDIKKEEISYLVDVVLEDYDLGYILFDESLNLIEVTFNNNPFKSHKKDVQLNDKQIPSINGIEFGYYDLM